MSMFVVAPTYHHHHYRHHHDSLNLSSHDQLGVGVGVGVIPLLTAAPVLPSPTQNVEEVNKVNLGGGGVHHFWQNINTTPTTTTTNGNNNNPNDQRLLLQSGNGNTGISHGGGGGGGGISGNSGASSSGGGGSATCQDCGNQAKKDCSHGRCRTCCKSRGFDCTTHVKSTWVPAARRRERQLIAAAATEGGGGGIGGVGSCGSTSHGVKKARLNIITSQANTATTTSHTSNSNNTATPPRSFDTSSSHQDAGFKESLPGQVRAPAVFKCVRVTAMDDGEDEYAYQAVVRIGGHVFKGFLYDQGRLETRDSFPNLSELHLGAGGGGVAGGGGIVSRNAQPSSSPIIDPSDVYGASSGGLLGGPSYGNI